MNSGLVLWDVDGTLVSTSSVSAEIYARAFDLVVGRPLRVLADMVGRTERAIITETFALNGVEDTDGMYEAFYAALGEAADQLRDRLRTLNRALPGAARAVAALAGAGVVQSVVTGNIRSIAVVKLEVFGLSAGLDLHVGGYGDDGADRAVLVALARERAAARYGREFSTAGVVVLGDTPHDVRGALHAGARAVGVATGASGVDELAAAGAHAVLHDLTDPVAVRAAVLPDA